MQELYPWELKESPLSDKDLASLEEIGISRTLSRLLAQRGVHTPEEAKIFLNPLLKYLGKLEEWPTLSEGAELISQTVREGNKVAVWGDYDADGITATALLLDFFRKRTGKHINYFLPHRLEHGYGMNTETVEQLHSEGVKTIVTVDCGITNIQEIARAKELGMNVILTDHHLPGEELPVADVIINPKVNECPHTELAGVGIAFYLAAQLNYWFEGDNINILQFLDLVALGTIADIVNLDRTNRVLVRHGLKYLVSSTRPGITALKKFGGVDQKSKLGAFDIGFILGPRINASGRMASPDLALNLLLQEDQEKADEIAQELDKLNQDRKKIQQEIFENAVEEAERQGDMYGLVLCGDDWHPGVVGIVASKVVEEYECPCFVLTQQNGVLTGSGRSVPDINLFDTLSSLSDILENFGGHSQAAGVTLKPEQLDEFRQRFDRACAKSLSKDHILPSVVDLELALSELNFSLINELEYLEPYGPENPEPEFLSPELLVVEQRQIGQDKTHLKLKLKDQEGSSLYGLMWGQAEQWGENALMNKKIRVSYCPEINEFNGERRIQIIIQEVLAVS